MKRSLTAVELINFPHVAVETGKVMFLVDVFVEPSLRVQLLSVTVSKFQLSAGTKRNLRRNESHDRHSMFRDSLIRLVMRWPYLLD